MPGFQKPLLSIVAMAGLLAGIVTAAEPVPRSVTTKILPDPFPNAAPKARPRQMLVEAGKTTRGPSVLLGVYDPEGDRLSIDAHGKPEHGSVAKHDDGSFTYTPTRGFTGSDGFEFTIRDAHGATSSARMSIRVVAPGGTVVATGYTGLAPLEADGFPIRHDERSAVPRLADVDRDGRTDLLVAGAGRVWFHRNIGRGNDFSLDGGVPLAAGDDTIAVPDGSRIGIGWHDLDGDDLADLVVASQADRSLSWYRNATPPAGPPAFEPKGAVPAADGGDAVAPDVRIDLADVDGDGLADLVAGTWSGDVTLSPGIRLADGRLAFAPPTTKLGSGGEGINGSYNLNVRATDIDGDGLVDLVDSANWGTIQLRVNAGADGAAAFPRVAKISVSGPDGGKVDLHALCDGPIVDFADLDGDGTLDIVVGGEKGGSIHVAHGIGTAAHFETIRATIAAHPHDLGAFLADPANVDVKERLKGALAAFHDGLVSMVLPAERIRLTAATIDLIKLHPALLGRTTLDAVAQPGMPSLAGQLWMTVLEANEYDPGVRRRLADAAGFKDGYRRLLEECGLVYIDNARNPRGAEAIHQWLRTVPREVYPGTGITAADWMGGTEFLVRGHLKNTFNGSPESGGEYGFGADARPVIGDRGSENQFITVVHHEASHDLDAYVRRDPALTRRWGRMLLAAGGPDMRGDPDTGWFSMERTRDHFREAGLWDGDDGSWQAAWQRSWETPPGSAWRREGFMRGNIDWFYGAVQESLATQGNQHWNSTEGRLEVAADRWDRGFRGNLTEVLLFIDLWSAGLDKGTFYETDDACNQILRRVKFRRSEQGAIDRIDLGDRHWEFAVDDEGVVTDIVHRPIPVKPAAERPGRKPTAD